MNDTRAESRSNHHDDILLLIGRDATVESDLARNIGLLTAWAMDPLSGVMPDDVDPLHLPRMLTLLGDDFALAVDIPQLRRAIRIVGQLFEQPAPENSVSFAIGDERTNPRRIRIQRAPDGSFERFATVEDDSRVMPKSMRHWMEKAGIRLDHHRGWHRRWRTDGCFIGESRKPRFVMRTAEKRRVFRVLPHVELMQICDGYFDRWANSVGASVRMPRTQTEFDQAIERLIELSEPNLHGVQENERQEPQAA